MQGRYHTSCKKRWIFSSKAWRKKRSSTNKPGFGTQWSFRIYDTVLTVEWVKGAHLMLPATPLTARFSSISRLIDQCEAVGSGINLLNQLSYSVCSFLRGPRHEETYSGGHCGRIKSKRYRFHPRARGNALLDLRQVALLGQCPKARASVFCKAERTPRLSFKSDDRNSP